MSFEGVPTLRTNLADSPVVAGLKDGRITSELFKFDFCGPKQAHNGFKDMIRRGLYDCGEMAIVTYLQAKAYNKPLLVLPLPVSGRPQHHCIGFNKELWHLDPKDIEGKKVGVRTYAQTTGLWVRGVLQHEYGVDLNAVQWQVIDESHLEEYKDPSNATQIPKESSLPQMMLDGEIKAAILGNDMPKDPRVQLLIPNAVEAGWEWCKRESVLPINHMFVVSEALANARPDIVQEIARMLRESNALAPESVRTTQPPLGLEVNRKTIALAAQYAFEQKIIPAPIAVDDLFTDLTASL